MIYTLPGRKPSIHENTFIAPSADIIGSVSIDINCSIWFNTVLRGEADRLTIGHDSNIQDNSVLHTDPGIELEIGNYVTVGHCVMLHGCKIGDYSLIGIGSTILNNASIGRYCLVGANTLITECKTFPDYSLIMGSPGKVIRSLNDREIRALEQSAATYVTKIELYKQIDKID